MLNTLIEILPFIASSVTAFALLFYKISLNRIQQGVSFLLVVVLLLFIKAPNLRNKFLMNIFYRLILIYVLSLFVQLLIISTGGFFSPLLIIVHIFTLGVSLLLNIKSAAIFLVFSLAILISNVLLNESMMALFKEDPASVILYIISFLIIIPLAQTISRTYHLKGTLLKKLGEYLQISENREESILRGLNDFVIITDEGLNILYANKAVQNTFKLSEVQFIKKPFLSILPILDANGAPATEQSLQIENLVKDKYARTIEGFNFKKAPDQKSTPVSIQIKPIVNQRGIITQIVFVITDAPASSYKKAHPDLDQALDKQKVLFEQIKYTLIKDHLENENFKLELFNKGEEDIFIIQELEDHAIQMESSLQDVAYVCKTEIIKKAEFAKNFGVDIQLVVLDDEFIEMSYIKLLETNAQIANEIGSTYTLLTDPKWLGILIDKMIDIAVLLSSTEKNRVVKITVKQEINGVGILVAAPVPVLTFDIKDEIFKQFYGNLGFKTNLKLGSGLEGFIAKLVAAQMKIPIEVRDEKQTGRLIFSLQVNKV